ncbi:dicarboxylate/amino acid:cation symporter [Clostridium tertium]|uniref:dicarboxylate/amino acid:cation symporter n=1 Tax=Clostridium tertium TaxID=1559 RepID=UPI00232B668F|nr:dicarboxylate/amino acid:cation symporter [Clostridium tertium]MDB1954034.1 dicarboxylate/amino acid:cation symporter [Clostridium tertium]MDB1957408.1 dicarboxylate/amino acid:cation symporter [Clostridium tertium]MDB1960699.1 dicarboxylate/amino acid:cation symporter [Clostridium tertium]MDB1965220.1 dicarboxylate/amino acid:cation symporter [Clostridium tertium]
MKNTSLILKIFIALVLGITLGIICKSLNLDFPIRLLATFSELFGSFLSFIIPLIMIGFIVPGIASLGNKSGKGLLITTIVAYISTLCSGFLAFSAGSYLLPKFLKSNSLVIESSNQITTFFSIDIPPIMSVMSALVFSFIMGISLSKIKNSSILNIFNEFSSIVTKIISNMLIPIVPIYVGAIFSKLSFSGEIFSTLKSFALVYIILFALQGIYIIIQYSFASSIKKENPLKLLKNMLPAYLTAAGTQSSSATIPVTIECVNNNDVSEEVTDFVIPLSATIHLAGDTITLVLTSMAVMYMTGRIPTFSLMLPFIFMLGVTMVAAPGVPGGGVMAALGILESMLGFGTLEKPIMIALHAAQDSFGTATNVTGDGAIAILVDKILKDKETSNENLSDFTISE